MPVCEGSRGSPAALTAAAARPRVESGCLLTLTWAGRLSGAADAATEGQVVGPFLVLAGVTGPLHEHGALCGAGGPHAQAHPGVRIRELPSHVLPIRVGINGGSPGLVQAAVARPLHDLLPGRATGARDAQAHPV